MRFRGTAFLFLLLAALAVWVYWTEIRGREARGRAEDAAGKVLPVDAADIEEISLVYPDRVLRAVRAEGGWNFVSPVGLEADAAGWDQVAANVGRVERGETVTEEPADLAQYGLDEAFVRVEVRLSDERTEEIRFGNENPAGEAHYASVASSPGVFLTAITWRGLFLKETDDLRDRTLLRFGQGDIDGIEIAPSGVVLVLEEGEWFIEGPPRLRADDSEIASFLGALRTTRATGFAEPAAGAFEIPTAEVILDDRATDQRHVLSFGRAVPEDAELVYARDASRGPVFTVGVDLRNRALSRVPLWRDKTIAAFDPDSVVSIRIERADGPALALEKSADAWALSDGRAVSDIRIQDILGAFEFQEASEVIDTPGAPAMYGLDSPRLRVVFGDGTGDVLDFHFGNEAAGGRGVYWKSTDEAAVKVVPMSVLSPFDVEEEDLVGE